MEAYRDQYATIFRNGKDVSLIAVSTDADTAQASWAREGHYPLYFASDPDRTAGAKYDVNSLQMNYEKRVVFVIGPDGKVAHIMRPFRELVGDSYTELGDAVAKATGGASGKP